jgi:predicted DCC family thiol-disulfide oxidoreductase YuxK
VRFVLERDRRPVFRFASLQSETGRGLVERFGHNPNELNSFFVVANYRRDGERMLGKSLAVLFVARELGWPWKAAGAFGLLPLPLRDRTYDLIARSRYRVFGRFEQCQIPPPEFRRRFIDP